MYNMQWTAILAPEFWMPQHESIYHWLLHNLLTSLNIFNPRPIKRIKILKHKNILKHVNVLRGINSDTKPRPLLHSSSSLSKHSGYASSISCHGCKILLKWYGTPKPNTGGHQTKTTKITIKSSIPSNVCQKRTVKFKTFFFKIKAFNIKPKYCNEITTYTVKKRL